MAIHSTKALNANGLNEVPRINVNQYDFTGNSNQLWLFKDAGNGYYNIISKANGLFLDIANEEINKNGANVQLYYKNNSESQKFKLTPVNIINNGRYEIETKINSNKVIDVKDGSQKNKANAQIWTGRNISRQRFYFEAISSDTTN